MKKTSHRPETVPAESTAAAAGCGGADPAVRILTIVLIYAAFAALWILLSDRAVALLFSDPAQITLASTVKGWLFVVVTSLLLYGLMRGRLGAAAAQPATVDGRSALRSLALPVGLAAVVVVALTAIAIGHNAARLKEVQAARLHAIADLKVGQIDSWLHERRADMQFLHSSGFLSGLYADWRNRKNLAARDLLLRRLGEFGANYHYRDVLLLDGQGEPLLDAAGKTTASDPVLVETARRAAADGKIHLVGPYRGVDGQLHIDLVASFRPEPGAEAAIALRIDPATFLYPLLGFWPEPSASAETLLFRRDGDGVVFLNDLRHAPDAALQRRLPLTSDKTLAVRSLVDAGLRDRIIEGTDYRDAQVLGIVQPVPGTDWFLVAKLDRTEVYAETGRDAVWITLAGLLALVMIAAGVFVVRQRQQLFASQIEQAAQAEKMRALKLLDAIAQGSTDVIFAKDLAGRYLLFNREAARVTGKPAEVVLGRDDTVLFPPDQAELIMRNDRQVMEEGRTVVFQETLDTADGQIVFLATKGPLRDAEGRVAGLFGISRDITERERASQALRASEERYRIVLEHAADAVFVVRADGRYVYANQRAARMLGYGVDELLAMGIADLVPAAELETALDTLRQLAAQGHLLVESNLKRKDGGIVPVEINAVQLPDGNLYGACRDIGERRRAEAALRENEERLRALFEFAHDAIMTIAPPDWRFTSCNPATLSLFGVADEQAFRQLGPWDLSPERQPDGQTSAPAARRMIETALAQGVALFEWTHRRANGENFPASVLLTRMTINDQDSIQATVRDISGQKAGERDLREQAAELRSRNQELERFNRASVGRELDMIALKQQVNDLSRQLGREAPYPLAFVADAAGPPLEGGAR